MTNTLTSPRTYPPITDPAALVPLFLDYYNEGDMHGVAAVYETDAQLTAGPGDYYSGHDVIVAAMKSVHVWGYRLHCKLVRMHVAGDIAVSAHELAFTNLHQSEFELATITTEVMRRGADGGWRVVIDDPFWLVPHEVREVTETSLARSPEEIVPLFLERYVANDMQGLADLYAEDAVVHLGGGELASGRRVIRAVYSMMRAVGIEMTAERLRVHQVGDVALMQHRLTVPRHAPDGGDVASITTETARRSADGGWRLVVDDPMWIAD